MSAPLCPRKMSSLTSTLGVENSAHAFAFHVSIPGFAIASNVRKFAEMYVPSSEDPTCVEFVVSSSGPNLDKSMVKRNT